MDLKNIEADELIKTYNEIVEFINFLNKEREKNQNK